MPSVTCLECKSEVPSGLDACPECGFDFAERPAIKCPECSQVVVFAGGICPECGFPYDALDELLLDDEVTQDVTPGSQAEQLPVVAKHAAAASAALSMLEVDESGVEVEIPSAAEEVEGEIPPAAQAPSLGGEQVANLNELIANLSRYLEEFKSGSDGTVSELSVGVEKFLEGVEALKLDNQSTLQGMQEIAGKFGDEMKGVAEALGSAKASAIGEINNAAQQGKAELVHTSEEIQNKVTGTVDYIFYISLALVLFTALNMAVTMYVVKLVK